MSMVKSFVKEQPETKEMERIPQVYAFHSQFSILSTCDLSEGSRNTKCHAYSAVVRAILTLHTSSLRSLGVHTIAT